MPKRCAAFGCRGNYKGQPYSRVVRFPSDEEERRKWIESMPNKCNSLKNRSDLFVCASHFDCEWVNVRGGKRPSGPPTIFAARAKTLKTMN
jgi:hypothetical protein